MKKGCGKIVIDAKANVWPHELESAKALASAGYTVEFIFKSEVGCATARLPEVAAYLASATACRAFQRDMIVP